jgi:hypothetical protein
MAFIGITQSRFICCHLKNFVFQQSWIIARSRLHPFLPKKLALLKQALAMFATHSPVPFPVSEGGYRLENSSLDLISI